MKNKTYHLKFDSWKMTFPSFVKRTHLWKLNSDKSPADGVSFPYVNLGLEMHTSAAEMFR